MPLLGKKAIQKRSKVPAKSKGSSSNENNKTKKLKPKVSADSQPKAAPAIAIPAPIAQAAAAKSKKDTKQKFETKKIEKKSESKLPSKKQQQKEVPAKYQGGDDDEDDFDLSEVENSEEEILSESNDDNNNDDDGSQIEAEENEEIENEDASDDQDEQEEEDEANLKSEIVSKFQEHDFDNDDEGQGEAEAEIEEEPSQAKKLTEAATVEEKEVINRTHLAKYWEVSLSQPSIYTGGRIVVSPNEEFIGSIANFKVVLTNIATRTIINTITHEDEELCNFAIHPSNKFIATFTRNNILRFVNIATKEVVHLWRIGDQWALDMVFDSTGQFLAVGCVDGFIKVYDVKKGNLTHNYKVHRGSVTKILFHPTPTKFNLVSVGEDHAIRVYDLVISSVLKSIVAHTEMVTQIIFTEDGSNLLSASADSKIIVWDYASMTKQAEVLFDEQVEAMGYFKIKVKANKKNVTQSYLVATGASGVLKLIDITSNNISIHPFSNLQTHEIIKIMTLPKKEQICAVTVEQNVIFYDFEDGPKLVESDIIVGFNDEITDAKFSKRDRKENQVFDRNQEYMVVATNSNLMKSVELGTGKTRFIKGHKDFVLTLDMYGAYLISAGKDKTIKLWKKNNENMDFQLLGTFLGHIESISSVNFGPKTGRAFVSGSEDKNVKIWDSSNLIARSHKITKPETVTIAKRTVAAHTKDINVVRFSPNEKLVASASQDKQIKIWDAETLACRLILKGHKRGVWDVNFSPVEKLLVSASGDSTVKIWNLEDGQCVNTFEGHMGSVVKCSWLCYGLEIISAGADGLIKIWNTKKQTCLNTLNKHNGKIWALDISGYDANGKQLMLSGGNDSNLFVWDDVTKEEELRKKEEEHEVMIQQDNFNALIRSKDYVGAVKLAFQFNFIQKFHGALDLMFKKQDFKSEIIFSDEGIESILSGTHEEEAAEFENNIKELVANLVQLDLNKLLVYIRDLNTMQKSAKVAQRLLNYVLRSIPIDDFTKIAQSFRLPKKHKKILTKKPTMKKGGKKQQQQQQEAEEEEEDHTKIPSDSDKSEFERLMEILTSYSKRHAERMDRFIKKSYYLDFVLKKIDLLSLQSEENPTLVL